MIEDRYYTAVGSRETPCDVLDLMTRLAQKLAEIGFIGRSGGAPGADSAFEAGMGDRKQIFLPWKGFSPFGQHQYDPTLWHRAEEIAADPKVYPGFRRIQEQARDLEARGLNAMPGPRGRSLNSLRAILKLQTRNVFQVLGPQLDTPSEFTLCWTPDGALSFDDYKPGVTGGTGTAINLSAKLIVPVWNLQRPEHRQRFEQFLETGALDLTPIPPRPARQPRQSTLELPF